MTTSTRSLSRPLGRPLGRPLRRLLRRGFRAAAVPLFALLLNGCAATSWIPFVGGGDAPAAAGDAADLTRADGGLGDIDLLTRRTAAQPSEPYWPFRLGEVHAAAARNAEAESALRLALARDAAHAPSLTLLSKIWYDAGRHEEAVEMLESARAAGPTPDAVRVALALHLDALGDLEGADALVVELTEDVDWSAGGSALTYVRLRGDGFTEAEREAQRALDAAPTAVNHNNYGITKLYAGDPVVARKHFETAVKLDPELPGPLYNLAIVDHFYLFETDRARDWFERYRELAEDDPDGLADALSGGLAQGDDTEGAE